MQTTKALLEKRNFYIFQYFSKTKMDAGKRVIIPISDKTYVTAISETHDELAEKVALFAGQKISIEEVMGFEKFTVGEFDPRFFLDDIPYNERKDITIVLFGTQSPEESPEGSMTRACMAAYDLKDFGIGKVVYFATELGFARADLSENEARKQIEERRKKGEDITKEHEEEIVEKLKGRTNMVRYWAQRFKGDGIDHVKVTHVHNPVQTHKIYEEIFGHPYAFKNLNPAFILAHYLQHYSSLKVDDKIQDEGSNIVFVAVDDGAEYFVDEVMRLSNLPYAGKMKFKKFRADANNPEKLDVELNMEKSDFGGTLENKIIIVPDDGDDTDGTMRKIYNWLFITFKEKDHGFGMPAEFFQYFTHAWLGGESYNVIQKELLKSKPSVTEVVTTNTRPYISDRRNRFFKRRSSILRLAKWWGHVINRCIDQGENPDELYRFEPEQLLDYMVRSYFYHIKRGTLCFLSGVD